MFAALSPMAARPRRTKDPEVYRLVATHRQRREVQ
jgi:hypothetical protein